MYCTKKLQINSVDLMDGEEDLGLEICGCHTWRIPHLKEDAGELGVGHADGGEVRETHEGVALPEGEGVSHQEE